MCLQDLSGGIAGVGGRGWRARGDFTPEAAKNRAHPKRELAGQNSAKGVGRKGASGFSGFQRRLAAKAANTAMQGTLAAFCRLRPQLC